MYNFPKELKYNKDNSWIKIDKDVAIIGINEAASKKVVEFVYINLPEKNKEIKKNDVYVSLESIKWSGHLKSPVSGKIIDVNDKLFLNPSLINKDPYKNWIVKIKMKDENELKELIDYKEIIKEYKE
jgi:glycine cleavage system H protein